MEFERKKKKNGRTLWLLVALLVIVALIMMLLPDAPASKPQAVVTESEQVVAPEPADETPCDEAGAETATEQTSENAE